MTLPWDDAGYRALPAAAYLDHASKLREYSSNSPPRPTHSPTLSSRLNVTGDPEVERLADDVRRSLLVDPKELRPSEASPAETARAAAVIAQQMAGYMAGYQPAAPAGPVAA